MKHFRWPDGSSWSWASRCEEKRQRAQWRHMSSRSRACRRVRVGAAQGPGGLGRRLSWRCRRVGGGRRGGRRREDERSVAECVICRNTTCQGTASAQRSRGGCNDTGVGARSSAGDDRRSSSRSQWTRRRSSNCWRVGREERRARCEGFASRPGARAWRG